MEDTTQLLARRRRLVRSLPPLTEIVRGTVLTRQLRCGKPGCHCVDGPGHASTYLAVSFGGGRTQQISLPAPLVAQAQSWVANYNAWWKAVEAISAINRELLRRRRDEGRSAPRRESRGRRL